MDRKTFDFSKLSASKDLSVPDWGPYGKLYAGVSHLVRRRRRSADFMFAFRADGAEPVLPYFADNACRNFHAFGASPGLGRFSYKFDLQGLEDLVAVVEFRPAGDACAAEVRLVNRTAAPRGVRMEILAAIPPELRRPPELNLRPGEVWIPGEDYAAIETWVRRMEDGFRNLVKFDRDAVGGRCLSGRWAILPGTRVTYRAALPAPVAGASLGIRFQNDEGGDFRHWLLHAGRRLPLAFEKGAGYRWLWVALGDLPAGTHEFSLLVDPESRSAARRDIYGIVPGHVPVDGLAISARPRGDLVVAAELGAPDRTDSAPAGAGRVVLSSELLGGSYAVAADERLGLELASEPMLFAEGRPARPVARGGRLGCLRSGEITVPAGGELRMGLAFSRGDDQRSALARLPAPSGSAAPPAEAGPPVPERFELGHRLLAANCLMNVSYPCFLPSEPVATYTPGKTWGGFYSWDAGMHGLGLLEVDLGAAVEILNVYLCGPEDPADFIWHGTPLPVQAHLLNELWSRTRDRELLGYFYPRIRKFYRYLLGHTPGSPTNRFGTGLLNTFPLFYNTGGWDDLPPQVAVHAEGIEDQVTPVCSTAHAVRFSRLMRRFARELGGPASADVAGYDADIARGLAAVERTWDPAEGVYSYVRHATFEPFRHGSGANFNHTLDAMTPLVAGGVDPARAAGLLARLGDPRRYSSPVGLSTVDQSAPYYDPDGYWNGSVWIPHQWFMWRAALDWGEARLARLIPRQAAEVWEREARRTHCSAELFKIATGLGAGYPHFAGLSAPVLGMIAAVARPGRVTTGYDTEVRQAQLDGRGLSFEYRVDGPSARPALLAVMPAPGRYAVEPAGGARQTVEADDLGCAAFPLPPKASWSRVTISPA
jgi:hypothetical protein